MAGCFSFYSFHSHLPNPRAQLLTPKVVQQGVGRLKEPGLSHQQAYTALQGHGITQCWQLYIRDENAMMPEHNEIIFGESPLEALTRRTGKDFHHWLQAAPGLTTLLSSQPTGRVLAARLGQQQSCRLEMWSPPPVYTGKCLFPQTSGRRGHSWGSSRLRPAVSTIPEN